jgi:hypothetical protein
LPPLVIHIVCAGAGRRTLPASDEVTGAGGNRNAAPQVVPLSMEPFPSVEDEMRQLIAAAVVAALAALASPALSLAQGAEQKITTVDVKSLGTGLRASKVIGSDVVNENKETIGKIDDLLVSTDAHNVFAVISVGGFLGIGSKLVAVRYEELRRASDTPGLILPGASKESLSALPEYTYAR